MSPAQPGPAQSAPGSTACQIAADTAALDALILLSLRAAEASVRRLEDLTAKAAGWTDPREIDPTVPVARMGRCIRQCIALKARLPALYAATPPPAFEPRPRAEHPEPPAQQPDQLAADTERLAIHEPFGDHETLADPPLTQQRLERLRAGLTQAVPPPPSVHARCETIRRTLEPEIDAHPDRAAADGIERKLSEILEDEVFPHLLDRFGVEELTERLRRTIGLRPFSTADPAPG